MTARWSSDKAWLFDGQMSSFARKRRRRSVFGCLESLGRNEPSLRPAVTQALKERDGWLP